MAIVTSVQVSKPKHLHMLLVLIEKLMIVAAYDKVLDVIRQQKKRSSILHPNDDDDSRIFYDLPTKMAMANKRESRSALERLRDNKSDHRSCHHQHCHHQCHHSHKHHNHNQLRSHSEGSNVRKTYDHQHNDQHVHVSHHAPHCHQHKCHHHHCHKNPINTLVDESLLSKLRLLEANLDQKPVQKKFIYDPDGPQWTDPKPGDKYPLAYSAMKTKLKNSTKRISKDNTESKTLYTRQPEPLQRKPEKSVKPSIVSNPVFDKKIEASTSSKKTFVTDVVTRNPSPAKDKICKMLDELNRADSFSSSASSSHAFSPDPVPEQVIENAPSRKSSFRNRKIAILNKLNSHNVTASISPVKVSSVYNSFFQDSLNSSLHHFLSNFKDSIELPKVPPPTVVIPSKSKTDLTFTKTDDARCTYDSSEIDHSSPKTISGQQSDENSCYDNCTEIGKTSSNEDTDNVSSYDSGESTSLSPPIDSLTVDPLQFSDPMYVTANDKPLADGKRSNMASDVGSCVREELNTSVVIDCDESSFLSLPSVTSFTSKTATIRPIRSSTPLSSNLTQQLSAETSSSVSGKVTSEKRSNFSSFTQSADESNSFLAKLDQIIASCPVPTLDATTKYDQKSLLIANSGSSSPSSNVNGNCINGPGPNTRGHTGSVARSPSKLPSLNESLKHESLHDSVQHFLSALRDSMKLPKVSHPNTSLKSTSDLFNLTPHIDLYEDDEDDDILDDENVYNENDKSASNKYPDGNEYENVSDPSGKSATPTVINVSQDGIDKQSDPVLLLTNDDTDNVSSIQSDVVTAPFTSSNVQEERHNEENSSNLHMNKHKSQTHSSAGDNYNKEQMQEKDHSEKIDINFPPPTNCATGKVSSSPASPSGKSNVHSDKKQEHLPSPDSKKSELEDLSESMASFAAKELLILNDSNFDWDPVESVKNFVLEICREIHQIENPIDKCEWKWRVLTASSSSSTSSSVDAFKRFLVDLAEIILQETFRLATTGNSPDSNLAFKSLREMALYAKKYKYPCNSVEDLYKILYKEVAIRLNLPEESYSLLGKANSKKTNHTTNPLVLWKSRIVHDQADAMVIREMHKDTVNWLDFSTECNYLLEQVSAFLFDSLLEEVTQESLENVLKFIQKGTLV